MTTIEIIKSEKNRREIDYVESKNYSDIDFFISSDLDGFY